MPHLTAKLPSISETPKPNVLFVGSAYAGHRTRFANLQAHTEADDRIKGSYTKVTGWQEGGSIENIPFVPRGLRGRLRGILQSSAIAKYPRPDAIWTSVLEVAAPFMWSQLGPLRRPMIFDLDSTVHQLEAFAFEYYNRPPKQGLRMALAHFWERSVWRGVSLFTPWSNWAAEGLRKAGVPSDRIRVLPPGVDLNSWRPSDEPGTSSGHLRLLFVGGDFDRKGGNVLLDVFSSRFSGSCELDIVTRDRVESRPGVRIHRAEPNSKTLKDLYAQADLFVLPTRAECFGIATIEAMASGLPCIMGNVGGAADIVVEEETGWLIEPTACALTSAIERAISIGPVLKRMGELARFRAEECFDGKRNDHLIVELLLAEAERFHR